MVALSRQDVLERVEALAAPLLRPENQAVLPGRALAAGAIHHQLMAEVRALTEEQTEQLGQFLENEAPQLSAVPPLVAVLATANLLLLWKEDPVLRAALCAPVDDEPVTEEEERAIAEARAAYLAGEIISHEEIKREFGL